MQRKYFSTYLSRFGFLMRGRTTACLKQDGTVPFVKLLSIIVWVLSSLCLSFHWITLSCTSLLILLVPYEPLPALRSSGRRLLLVPESRLKTVPPKNFYQKAYPDFIWAVCLFYCSLIDFISYLLSSSWVWPSLFYLLLGRHFMTWYSLHSKVLLGEDKIFHLFCRISSLIWPSKICTGASTDVFDFDSRIIHSCWEIFY